jgi:hypothetical protein
MNLKRNFGSKIWGECETRIIDAATGKIVKRSKKLKNLVFDTGLNLLAGAQSGFGDFFETCAIGSGTNPNSVASGAVTFTQVATAITASAGFFNVGMVGAIFKYGAFGSGGAEYYITAYIDTTHVTVATSATVVSSTAATVWLVNQTVLQTPLYTSSTYQNSAGDNGTSYASNVIQLKRTFVFPVQSSPYNVNEIGYSGRSTPSGQVNGRVVLGSTDVVAPTQFFVCIWTLSYTQTPGSPTAQGNVGTNIDTTGNVMIQAWSNQIVNSDGTNGNNGAGLLDSSGSFGAAFHTGAISLNSTIDTSQPPTNAEPIGLSLNAFSNSMQPVGVGISTSIFSVNTSGQTINCIIAGNGNASFTQAIYVLSLTTPVTAPSGTFSGTLVLVRTFSRILTN